MSTAHSREASQVPCAIAIMKKTPPFLIVADRGHLVAYDCDFRGGGSVPRVMAEMSFSEGLERLSEQVTDRAGGFRSDGTMGRGNSAAERGRLLTEIDQQTYRYIGKCINHLLKSHDVHDWGFAAPSEMNRQILSHVNREFASGLCANLPRDLTRIHPSEILEHFEAA
jgi:hypothetical protein